MFIRALQITSAAMLLMSCGSSSTIRHRSGDSRSWRTEASDFLENYERTYQALLTVAGNAAWTSSTDVSELHTGQRTGADLAFSAFAGSRENIERARLLLEHRSELDVLVVRQLERVLLIAAESPQTNPELTQRRIETEARQSAILDGFEFCGRREGETCAQPLIANDIDRILGESTDLAERSRIWSASKENGAVLGNGLIELRDLRNAVAREMGYEDFFQLQVSDYGMTVPEMMAMLDRLVEQMRPLYAQLQCHVRHELAARYQVTEVPTQLPAHWVGNRWAQSWPGLVSSVDMDSLVAPRTPEWVVQQAERFYTSMGFPSLPASFWQRSDLYPVPEGQTRRKNSHASAWHVDLDHDVRSLMSVENNWEWFETTHHELGHIYYYLAYTRDEVPVLLREGANRSFHEGIGDLISLASSQVPYLREAGIATPDFQIDEISWLMDRALTGPVVFIPFAAGTMSHFEHDLYRDGLTREQLNERWWQHVAHFQGVVPPEARGAEGCDACTKTHIIDDPGEYYDYALSSVLYHQLHDHICNNILHQSPRACSYYGHPEVGDFLRRILTRGATEDWRTVLSQELGAELSAQPMMDFFEPLLGHLQTLNQNRQCTPSSQ